MSPPSDECGVSSLFVFVVGGDIPDRGIRPDRVVLHPHLFEFALEQCGVPNLDKVGPFAFDVAEQRLDVRLISGHPRPAGTHSQSLLKRSM